MLFTEGSDYFKTVLSKRLAFRGQIYFKSGGYSLLVPDVETTSS